MEPAPDYDNHVAADVLIAPITRIEVERLIMFTKPGTAAGIYQIRRSNLIHPQRVNLLSKFFNLKAGVTMTLL